MEGTGMADEKAQKFGRAVAALRERLGLSQKELAQRAGITPSHLSRIESGDRMPGEEIIARLAESLNAPGFFLIAGLLVPEGMKAKHRPSSFTVLETVEVVQFQEHLNALVAKTLEECVEKIDEAVYMIVTSAIEKIRSDSYALLLHRGEGAFPPVRP
ncbi:MAG: XRE family transcriptional regulator [Desulforudis sp.]|jgi:transcriptional regulator with XRE-family HTH domain|nr:MAG: XRE family transcriptional regulator [Desulforudis sp.]